MPNCYPASPDDGFQERLRGGRNDVHENGDRGYSPDPYFSGRQGDHGSSHGDAPVSPMQPHDGGNLGWGDSAWNDAGGFESVLFGHTPDGGATAGGFAPVIVFDIENIDIDFNTLIQTTQIQNTLALLDASNGGTIDVGGNVTALGLQSASTENSAGFMNFLDLFS